MNAETILITGASRGIGAGIATVLARHLANTDTTFILVAHKSDDKLQALARHLQEHFHVQVLTKLGDIGDATFSIELSSLLQSKGLQVTTLINNAGVSHIGLLQDMTNDQWQYLMNTNVNSVFYLSRMVIPGMLSVKSGRIINISSVWGNIGASCEVAYSASKGALNSYTKALAKELAPSNISVNALACGVIDTDMNACFDEDERLKLIEEIPSGRFGTPSDVGEVIVSILSSPAYMTGQIINLDGGWQ